MIRPLRESVCERCGKVVGTPLVAVLLRNHAVTYHWTCTDCGNEWSTSRDDQPFTPESE
jgi:hypothetical protein